MDTNKLEKLYELKKKGILTDKEFQEQKKILLNLPQQTPVVPWKKAYVSFWKKSFDWSGRATRAEYWWPLLTNGLIGFVFGIVMAIWMIVHQENMLTGISLPTLILMFVFVAPNLSVLVRRLHDLGYSTKMAVLPFVLYEALYAYFLLNQTTLPKEHPAFFVCMFIYFMVYGVVWGIIFPVLPGQQEKNKYGNPR